MKTSKKILILVFSLLLIFGIALGLATPTVIFLPQLSYWIWVAFYVLLIFLGDYGLRYIKDVMIIKKSLDIYNSKPYKQYAIDTTCQSCGHKEVQAIDFDTLEYKCENCKRKNAIYVTYTTAAVTSPENINIL